LLALDFGDAPAPYPTADVSGVAGTLDASFDTDGKTTSEMDGTYDRIEGLALQADGKIVAVGAGGPYNTRTLDDAGGSPAVAVLPDRKILVAYPRSYPNPRGFAVMRLTEALGNTHSSFGNGGNPPARRWATWSARTPIPARPLQIRNPKSQCAKRRLLARSGSWAPGGVAGFGIRTLEHHGGSVALREAVAPRTPRSLQTQG
jgi:hypothetical protein